MGKKENELKTWNYIKEIEKSGLFKTECILRCIRNKIKSSQNYKWKLYDN